MTDLIAALAAPNQPTSYFKALETLVQDTVGAKLFTLMEVDYDRNVARRNYSNMPEAYPTSGEKPRTPNAWSEIVETNRQTFVANSIDDISAVFPDYELIQSLGCESCMNVPVFINQKLVGTLNCLHDAGFYTPGKVAAAEGLKQAGAVAFLLAAQMKGTV
ncbi:MAG: GAF domain-containing protein [Paracoccaceae bacterium]